MKLPTGTSSMPCIPAPISKLTPTTAAIPARLAEGPGYPQNTDSQQQSHQELSIITQRIPSDSLKLTTLTQMRSDHHQPHTDKATEGILIKR